MHLSPSLHTGAKPELSMARFVHHVHAKWELSCSCSLQTHKISLSQIVCHFGALPWSKFDFFICLSCLSWKMLNLLPTTPVSLLPNFTAFGAWEFGVLISSPLVPESHLGASLAFPGHQEVMSPDAHHRQEKNKCFQRVSYSYTLSPPSACCIERPST